MTMPGLTIATDSSAVAAAHGAVSNPPPLPTTSSRTSRSPSPTRPPMSPITPTLAPAQLPGGSISTRPLSLHQSPSKRGTGATPNNTNNIPSFAQGRPTFTHSQRDQVGIPPPPAPPEPIAFDDNPDVLALKSAITILQLQRARATADMQALSRAKAAAIENPGAFVADLAAGRVGITGDPLLSNPDAMADSDSSSLSSSSEDSDSEAESSSEPGIDTNRPPKVEDAEGDISMTTTAAAAASPPPSNSNSNASSTPSTTATITQPPDPHHHQQQQQQQPKTKRRKGKRKSTRASPSTPPQPTPAWRKLPKPQTIVRCPPVNWAQYGVVGESLDKLHAEQLAAPTPGAPTVLGPGGTYEFKAGPLATGGGEPAKRLVGIAAAYTPGRDKIDKKAKGGKR